MVRSQDLQLSNLVQREAQFLGLPDELERLNFITAKQAKAALGASRPSQQTLLLVATDGVDANAGFVCNLPDLGRLAHQSFCSHTYNTIWSQLQSQVFIEAERRPIQSIPLRQSRQV